MEKKSSCHVILFFLHDFDIRLKNERGSCSAGHIEEKATKLLGAQTHIWNNILSFINSMTLKCAVDLSIPDIIHKYGQPMPLSQLVASLPIHPSKTCFIYRLMRVLINSGFFDLQKIPAENDTELVGYVLTDASMLLLRDHPLSMASLFPALLDTCFFKPWLQVSTWFTNEDPTPFHTENGTNMWDYLMQDPKLSHLFNDAMACESRFVSNLVIEKCKGVFEGLESLVDVGGGTGSMAKVIANSFPGINCIVFDLPHVVAGLQPTHENINFVGGDMFQAIPSADSILLKWILHDWNDEDCVKILNKCKEAITSHGKVIIIEIVMENEKEEHLKKETQLFLDMQMMVYVTGKERNEKEWTNLILSGGFSNFKITPALGLYSLIELYP
ncbi:hypothetical protein RJT34_17300 [Clitoria ternatea]|uniref:isoflavone 7-O-methyltransferase n=1 Tax=Clitoria ternatea TaxID=43366 RepID=A0AAN9PDP0_CLITE